MSKSRSPFMQSRTDAGAGPLVFSDPRTFGSGNVFFVQSTNSNAGDSAGHGETPDAPFATIDYAIGQCTANQNDVIIALPGHADLVSAAAGIVFDVAGVSLIGVGKGTKQPKITFDTAITADLDIDAANILIENIHFTANFADITAPIDVNAQFCTIRN